MIYGYIRVSTDKQTVENQRFEINRFLQKTRFHVDSWIEETISGTVSPKKRNLGKLIEKTLISQRTKEALNRKKAQGVKLGRPKGKKNTTHKLSGCDAKIKRMLLEGYPKTLISKQLNVAPSTLYLYMKEHKIF